MFEIFDESIPLVDLEHVNDIDVESGMIELSWDGLLPLLTTHEYRRKKDGRCFIPVKMKPRDEWVLSESDNPSYRNDANIAEISMAVIDLDHPGAKEKAEKEFEGFEYVMYSTHSYTKDSPYKFRVVVRLESPIPADDWPKCFAALSAPIDGDLVCGNLSRVYYSPSHNPSAGLRPYVFHNPGKPLSMDDIDSIRVRYEAGLNEDERVRFLALSGNEEGDLSRGKKHFSGDVIPTHELGPKEVDFSYGGMKERMGKFLYLLDEYDSRHDFAMRVIGSEVARLGPRTDIFQLVQFLYKASTEHGSKPITDPSGDTRKELPELISSAVKKFCPEMVSGANPHFKDIRSYVRSVVSKVEQIAITDGWNFPSKPRKFDPMDDIRKRVGDRYSYDNSLESWRSRNKSSLRSLAETGNIVDFARDVAYCEYTNNPNVNVNMIGQFVFYCIKGYFKSVAGSTDVNRDLDRSLEILQGNVKDIIPENMGDDEERSYRFLRASFKIALASAKADAWRFSKDASPSAEQTLESSP